MNCVNHDKCKNPISRGKWCSDKCRKDYTRTKSDKVDEKVGQIELGQTKSDKKMTQAEIEAYYTLENFPRLKYYSSNGGGSGSYSPYPQNDKRSIVFALK